VALARFGPLGRAQRCSGRPAKPDRPPRWKASLGVASTFASKPQALLRETGNMFAVCLEGLRATPRISEWFAEYIGQCWLIAGAGGSAMTADLGSRKIRDEISAMEVMAVNPVHRLVTPRLWAASTVSLFL